MDILRALGDARLYNLHSHTEFCDGRAQMEAFAREVVRRGFTHYGFSPHSPIPFESPCNMAMDAVPRYLAEVERIRAAYPQVRWYASMEIDYLGRETGWGAANGYFDTLPLDYRISSVHFIPSQSGRWIDIDGRPERFIRNMSAEFGDDIRYVVETFYAQTLASIDEGGFDIIGHFDKIGLNASCYKPGIEDEAWYRDLVTRVIDHIADAGVIVEINTKAYADRGRFFPHERWWPQLRDRHIPLIINSDAHVPALIDASRPLAAERLAAVR